MPSIRPIARWMGCISAQNVPNGSAVMPEAVVSSTTENAPSWSVITQPRMDARMILMRLAALTPLEAKRLLRMIGR